MDVQSELGMMKDTYQKARFWYYLSLVGSVVLLFLAIYLMASGYYQSTLIDVDQTYTSIKMIVGAISLITVVFLMPTVQRLSFKMLACYAAYSLAVLIAEHAESTQEALRQLAKTKAILTKE